MRVFLIFIVAVGVQFVAGNSFCQTHLWRGKLNNSQIKGEVICSDCKLSGIPLSISRWASEGGYRTQIFYLNDAGSPGEISKKEVSYFNVISSFEKGGWFVVGNGGDGLMSSDPVFFEGKRGADISRKWQITKNTYLVNLDDSVWVIDAETGKAVQLDADISFVEGVAGGDGNIAITGVDSNGDWFVKGYNSDGEEFLEIEVRKDEGILEDLNMGSGGEFIEYSVKEFVRGEGYVCRNRVRVNIKDEVNLSVDCPTMVGRLVLRGGGFAGWRDGRQTIVLKFGYEDGWTAFGEYWDVSSAWVLPDGGILLSRVNPNGASSLQFLSNEGATLLEVPDVGSVFDVSMFDNYIVANSLGQTNLFNYFREEGK